VHVIATNRLSWFLLASYQRDEGRNAVASGGGESPDPHHAGTGSFTLSNVCMTTGLATAHERAGVVPLLALAGSAGEYLHCSQEPPT
jgi:hypothetical protein